MVCKPDPRYVPEDHVCDCSIPKPIPFRGFQGFCYVNRIPELKEKSKTGGNKT